MRKHSSRFDALNYKRAKNKLQAMDDRREPLPLLFDSSGILDEIDTIDEIKAKDDYEDTRIYNRNEFEV